MDQKLLADARQTVIQVLEDDPELKSEPNLLLKQYFEQKSGGISWDKIS